MWMGLQKESPFNYKIINKSSKHILVAALINASGDDVGTFRNVKPHQTVLISGHNGVALAEKSAYLEAGFFALTLDEVFSTADLNTFKNAINERVKKDRYKVAQLIFTEYCDGTNRYATNKKIYEFTIEDL